MVRQKNLKNRTAWNSRTPPGQTPPFRPLVRPPHHHLPRSLRIPRLRQLADLAPYWWVAWVATGWGLNLVLSLVWYLTDCDDENNYR
ncbi:MAG: hypothetical protein ACLRMJ_11270 [Alistipes finegoldii]